MNLPIPNRRAAGRTLAAFLENYRAQRELGVLALSSDGVPIAFEIAQGLDAPLDVRLVQKLKVAGHEEADLGMLVGRQCMLNDEVVHARRIRRSQLHTAVQAQQQEVLRRQSALLGDRRPLSLKDRVIILVDDVLSQSQTLRAAIKAAREEGAARVVVAVPVLPNRVLAQVQALADEVAFIASQEPFLGADWWYDDHQPLDPPEVRALLSQAAAPPVVHPSHPRQPVEAF